ncbi:hypothetical protein GpartN1_g97.t1 [Galdieria partita]|uniref:RING-type E3 ubiquitin transferase n=1 Tax=Galdieria partita TaxID=83374 RepID=A0A9C7UMJ0_9RHOD|nr:hypothetical protein GpartN1_g97.t1 [Galdieria partita]
MEKSITFWSEGDEELQEKVNETIRRHLLWSRRVNWEGTQLVRGWTKPKETLVRKAVLLASKFGNLKEYGCVICSLELKRSTVSCLYPCLHRFCYGCILKWLKVKLCCPLCLVTPEKLLFSIQSSNLFKETDIVPKASSSFKHCDLQRGERGPLNASNDSSTISGETLRGIRRQRDLVLVREERLKFSRKS